MENEIELLKAQIQNKDFFCKKVSNWTVGAQIEHSLKSIIGTSKLLNRSDPKDYSYNFNLSRLIVLTIGKMPRGRGKSPKQLHPNQVYQLRNLNCLLIKP